MYIVHVTINPLFYITNCIEKYIRDCLVRKKDIPHEKPQPQKILVAHQLKKGNIYKCIINMCNISSMSKYLWSFC